MNAQPHNEYRARLEDRRRTEIRLDRRHKRIGNARLVLAILAVYLVVQALRYHSFSPWWVLIPVLLFAGLAVFHESVIRALRRYSRAIAFYEKGLVRLDHRWMGTGETGEQFLDSNHAYSLDLDLFGKGSLYELLCTARTRMGKETLALWLNRPATVPVILKRQAAVSELQSRLELRERIAVLDDALPLGVRPTALAEWGEESPRFEFRPGRLVLAGFAALGLASLAGSYYWGSITPVLGMYVLNGLLGLVFLKPMRSAIRSAENAAHDLSLFSGVLGLIESQPLKAPLLLELQASLQAHGLPPSKRIRQLNRLLVLLDSRKNAFVAIFNPLVLWSLQLTLAIEEWRRESGPAIRRWLTAAGDMEALLSLASYSYEHPDDVFPEFDEAGPCFEAEGMAHPLLAEDRAVCNDLRLGRRLQVVIVSGSNMSGKSTFLRAAGVNAVLAQSGAPVRARHLLLSGLEVGASIRIQDSLQSGISRFYAEILRLHRIMETAKGGTPVLFLLDELLHGTNSHDRRIGAEAIIRGLIERGAVGLATTHDLALAQIADGLGASAANVHFEDQLIDGKLNFDYKLRPGTVQRSNAIALMRSVGLEI